MLHLGRTNAVSERAKSTMSGGMRISADYRGARQCKALLRTDDMHNSLTDVSFIIVLDTKFSGVVTQRVYLQFTLWIINTAGAVSGGNVVIHHSQGQFWSANLATTNA